MFSLWQGICLLIASLKINSDDIAVNGFWFSCLNSKKNYYHVCLVLVSFCQVSLLFMTIDHDHSFCKHDVAKVPKEGWEKTMHTASMIENCTCKLCMWWAWKYLSTYLESLYFLFKYICLGHTPYKRLGNISYSLKYAKKSFFVVL